MPFEQNASTVVLDPGLKLGNARIRIVRFFHSGLDITHGDPGLAAKMVNFAKKPNSATVFRRNRSKVEN